MIESDTERFRFNMITVLGVLQRALRESSVRSRSARGIPCVRKIGSIVMYKITRFVSQFMGSTDHLANAPDLLS